MFQRNIAAIATPSGKGGIAIIRISGENPKEIAKKMFTPTGKKSVDDFEPYRLYTGIIDGGSFSDYGMCVYFKAPKSYTGEDVIEFQCHGGESMARGILKRIFELGAFPADRGEFTKRAFLNGKYSLASCEGVADMINGESEAELRAGYFLYNEKLTKKIREVQDLLKNALASIGADVDYPEEDIEKETTDDIKETMQTVHGELTKLLNGYSTGRKVKSGVSVAICGKPNTGKSSLLNKLLGYDKAIVSDVAGTTRDAVEGVVEINGTKFNLYDTAGVRDSSDKIEQIGIDRAENLIKSADVCVFVADSFAGLDEEDGKVLSMLKDKPVIKVFNKIDLSKDETASDADVETSAITGAGIHKLKELLYEKGFGVHSEETAFLVEERHYNALKRAEELSEKVLLQIGQDPLDFLSVTITSVWETLGEITGETANETIIDEIFSKFCVGK